MAAGVVVLLIAADMGREEPPQVITQVAVLAWPEGEVEMVRQQAIGEQAHGDAFARFGQELDEGREVAVLVKDGPPAVAPVEDVVAEAASGSACGTRHV